jgi:hypothetical protein
MNMKVMSYKGYKACIMEAERLIGGSVFQLPPGNPIDVFYANQFDAYPEDWVKEGAFVIPVKPEKGLWFDFRGNSSNNTAVLMSVKGCNPITGLPLSGFHLEKYENKCPIHGSDFIGERYCKECGYKWPNRSYLSQSPLWWDGWMSEGVIRQFFFTKNMMRDVATYRIGKENTVPAFGFAFYSPKERRPESNIKRGGGGTKFQFTAQSKGIAGGTCCSVPMEEMFLESLCSASEAPLDDMLFESPSTNIYSKTSNCTLDGLSGAKSCTPNTKMGNKSKKLHSFFSKETEAMRSVNKIEEEPVIEKKETVSVGAGAKIAQELPVDPYGIDTWKDTPDSIMTIYFMFQKEFDELVSKGFHDIDKSNKGILEGIPVG